MSGGLKFRDFSNQGDGIVFKDDLGDLVAQLHRVANIVIIDQYYTNRPMVVLINDSCCYVDGVFECESTSRGNVGIMTGGKSYGNISGDEEAAMGRDFKRCSTMKVFSSCIFR